MILFILSLGESNTYEISLLKHGVVAGYRSLYIYLVFMDVYIMSLGNF